MPSTRFYAGFLCLLLSSCAEPGQPAALASDQDAKISFGLYDLHKGPSISDLFQPQIPQFPRAVSANIEDETSPQTKARVGVENASPRQTELAKDETAVSRIVIRNAEIQIEAAEPDAVQKAIGSIAEANKGYVVRSEQSMSDVSAGVRDSVSITIRVPSERFTSAIDAIHQTAGTLLVESEKGEDVTEEFVDIAARLTAKKALEAQFLEIMKQASTVEDALRVQTELSTVRADIEQIEGRKRFLENQSAYSTIKTTIQAKALFTETSAGIGYKISHSMSLGMNSALNLTLNLLTFFLAGFPLAVFIGVPAFYGGRAIWRLRYTDKFPPEASNVENEGE